MESNEFCFWLKGYLEGKDKLSKEEIEKLAKELQEVFVKITTKTIEFERQDSHTIRVPNITQTYC
jgi:hypothetical protein